MKLSLFALILFINLSHLNVAASPPPQEKSQLMSEFKKIQDSLKWHTGKVVLGTHLAILNLPPEFRYLGPLDTQKVLEAWGNTKGTEATLGMIFPSNSGPFDVNSWGAVISYEESGHISDDDAAKINYSDLLKTMQESMREHNKERKKDNLNSIDLVGWATPPHYDPITHKLFWAKEIKFNQEAQNTLNYNIRILGRKGVLVLNAVSSMEHFQAIENKTPTILSAIAFTPGNRYGDYKEGFDKLSSYGLGGLIAGAIGVKAIAKVGLLKGLLGLLLAFKKLILIGFAAIASFFNNKFKSQSKK